MRRRAPGRLLRAIAAAALAASAICADGPALALTAREAAALALARNRELRVRRLDVAIAGSRVAEARAAFDPTASADLARSDVSPYRGADPAIATVSDGAPVAGAGAGDTRATTAHVSLATSAPTGTTVSLDGSATASDAEPLGSAAKARVGVTVTQALLRGASPAANLAELRAARLDVRVSRWEVAGFAIGLAARAESAYWDLVLARRRRALVVDSLSLAERERAAVEDRIAAGMLAGRERAAADAEVAARRQSLIDADAREATARVALLALLQPAGELDQAIDAREAPLDGGDEADALADHLALARRQRPDLAEARLRVERGELIVIQARDGLLPRLDAFVSYGRTGYASALGAALRGIDADAGDAEVGVRFAYAFGARAARAGSDRAAASRAQAEEALANLEILDESDVRTAHLEVGRARAQIDASAASARAQEQAAEAEVDKLAAGAGTALSVAQAQRDLLQRRLEEAEAAVARRKALISLYVADGSLLERLGIRVPD